MLIMIFINGKKLCVVPPEAPRRKQMHDRFRPFKRRDASVWTTEMRVPGENALTGSSSTLIATRTDGDETTPFGPNRALAKDWLPLRRIGYCRRVC
jgi:hypothetical protein